MIFSDENQSSKTLNLYRGFELNEKEIKRMKKNVEGYIELKGFLSTSLKKGFIDAFVVNGRMIIEVKATNLLGMYDNGFAKKSSFSEHPTEKEVLVNALNVFKIISVDSNFDETIEKVVHNLHLEYGSIKPVEGKVEKSENLLDA
jgi:hypothetical protein